jgi:myxalamid-type polyketide synthase MxaB
MAERSERRDYHSLMKRALVQLEELQAEVDTLEGTRTEPLAVVGLACRTPGGTGDEDSFWRMLCDGGDAIREVPADRWDVDKYYHPDPDNPGTMYTRHGGFLDHVDQFDAAFFGISPREAVSLDPQQRVLLEVSWEALENAGLAPELLFDQPVGVFVGIISNDYTHLLSKVDRAEIDAYLGTGNAHSAATGRLSHLWGLQGPNMAVDTACSSSLVAVHLAGQSLRTRECDVALAGGVNMLLVPEIYVNFCKARMLSPEGRCKAFDAGADGYVRGEGCGVVVLKRLSDALADGDRIRAVIRGSAVNHDGRAGGLTVPNGPAQEKVIRQALANAGVQPAEVTYVEAHGTGTALGDPIELRALGAVFGPNRPAGEPLMVGSVKTSIGHLEGAAGIAGLIKVVLALEHGEIPLQPNFHVPNPHVDWDELPLDVPTAPIPWPAGGNRRIAGVSSFGFSGTNAHVVLEEAPAVPQATLPVDRPMHLLPLSAKSAPALGELAARYAAYLREHPEANLGDVCFTAATGRSHFGHRMCVVADSPPIARQRLEAFVAGQEAEGVYSGQPGGCSPPKIAWLFTGQGSQRPGMGRHLYETQPTFRRALQQCAELLQPVLEQPLLSLLYGEPDEQTPLHQTAYAQPALFALEYALGEVWKSWGIEPAVMLGHSVGEYVAACLAGVFSLDDGLRLIARRARLMQALPKVGTMVAVLAEESRVVAALGAEASEVSIAALNGPRQVVISGRREAVARVVARLQAQGVATQPLNVSHAFHSPLMEAMLDEFAACCRQVQFSPARVALISNLYGRVASQEVASAEYWCRHVRQTVRFSEGMRSLAEQGAEVFLEIGPKPVLLALGRPCVADADRLWLASLRPEQSDWTTMLGSLAALYVRGAAIDWQGFDRDYPRRKVLLPTYPFQRQRHWADLPKTVAGRSQGEVVGQSRVIHPLLGARLDIAGGIGAFQGTVSVDGPAFLADHRVYDAAVLPASAYLEIALAAGSQVLPEQNLAVEDVRMQHAMILPPGETRTVQTVLFPIAQGSYSFEILSRNQQEVAADTAWTSHVTGRLAPGEGIPTVSPDFRGLREGCGTEVPIHDLYQQFEQRGLQYGPSFRGIRWLGRGEGQAMAEIALPDALSADSAQYFFHPVILDSCFQALGGIDAVADQQQATYLPVGIGRLRVFRRPGRTVISHVKVRRAESGTGVLADFALLGDDGLLVALVEGLTLMPASRAALLRSLDQQLAVGLYEVTWRPAPNSTPRENVAREKGSWLILEDSGQVGEQLARMLEDQGQRCIRVFPAAAYQQTGDDRYLVNPAECEGFRRMLRASVTGEHPALRGVVYLWGLDVSLADDALDEAVRQTQLVACGSALHLTQALSQHGLAEPPRVWLVTRAAQAVDPTQKSLEVAAASLWGLGRVIAIEQPELRCVRIDMDPGTPDGELEALFLDLWLPDREDQLAYRQGARYAARLVPLTDRPTKSSLPPNAPFRLQLKNLGVLDDLEIGPLVRRGPGPGEVEIGVRAAGLNFRDVLRALGMFRQYEESIGLGSVGPSTFGFECSGTVTAIGEGVRDFAVGDDVLAVATGSLSSHVTLPARYLCHKPASMTFDEAATIPLAYVTVYYALERLARLRPGQRVLIHAAAGGVGQAAVQWARRSGAEVFATASPSKWEFLKSQGVRHVMNSRTLEFADQVRTLTQGEGVDVVLNSLSGDFIPRSLSVLKPGGCFVELGALGIWDETEVARQGYDVRYLAFDLVQEELRQPGLLGLLLHEVMDEFQRGALEPLPHAVFPIQDAVAAFRNMAQSKHVGKVIVSVPGSQQAASSTWPSTVKSEGSYLITGGLGALGLRVAHWLVAQGARHLVLVGRRGITSEAARAAVDQLRQSGAEVLVARADVSKSQDMEAVFAQARSSLPPLRGIVHAAGILDDGVLTQLTWQRFAGVMAPKVEGAWNLHRQAEQSPLEFFVCFSSAASLLGSPAQGNYAAANAFMDALAHQRRLQGMAGLSINWGPWADEGLAAERSQRDRTRWTSFGMGNLTAQQGLETLAQLISRPVAQVGALPMDWSRLPEQAAGWPFLAEIKTPSRGAAAADSEFLKQLAGASRGERHRLLVTHVRAQAARVLGFSSPDAVNVEQGFFELGIDSLMAMELRNRLQNLCSQPLPSTLVLDYPTIEALVAYLERTVLVELFASQEEQASPGEGAQSKRAAALEALSEDELADLLQGKLAETSQ